MLQHTRPGYHTLFGHMSDNEHRNPQALGNLHQHTGGFPYLAHAARCGCHILPEHGLDGIDDDDLRFCLADGLLDRIQICFA